MRMTRSISGPPTSGMTDISSSLPTMRTVCAPEQKGKGDTSRSRLKNCFAGILPDCPGNRCHEGTGRRGGRAGRTGVGDDRLSVRYHAGILSGDLRNPDGKRTVIRRQPLTPTAWNALRRIRQTARPAMSVTDAVRLCRR